MKTMQSLRFMTAFLGLFAVGITAQAVEPSDAFLKALRGVGYFDIATDYLVRAEKSPTTTVTFKRNIPYERGLLYFDASRVERDPALRQGFLDKSKKAFQAFLASKPQGTIVVKANNQMGNLIVEHARIKIGNAKENKSQQVSLMKEASVLYKEAYTAFDTSVTKLLARLKALPKVIPPTDKKRIAQRDELRKSYLEAMLLRAAILEESAEAEKPGGAEYNKILAEAGKQYGIIYEKYRTRLAGLYAVLYQGRCLQKIKKWEDAIAIYAELLETGEEDDPVLRNLKTKVLLQGMVCWIALKQPKEALEKVGPWVDDVRPNEESAQDWIDLRMIYLKFLVDSAVAKKNPNDDVAKKSFSAAGDLVTSLAKVTGNHQKELRTLRTKIPAKYIKGKIADEGGFKTFVEARDAGREALGTYQQNRNLITILPAQIRKTKDAKIKSALNDQYVKAKEEEEPSRTKAMDLFSQSLNLATDTTDIEDVNIVRYFLCYLHYMGADYYEAATIGEFLSRTYPQSAGVRQCAKITMASYLKLYSELGDEDDKSFETERTVAIAVYIADQWPDKAEAQEALGTLIPFMIQAGRLDEAEMYLKKIPEDSPRRGESELKTGQAFWSNYLRTAKAIRDMKKAGGDQTGVAAKEANLVDLKTRAEKMLSDGITRMKESGKASSTMVSAVLSLAQIYVDTDQASKAVVLLEDPEIGALTLVRKKDPATSREGFAMETYRTALRAYIYSLGDAPDPAIVVAKAKSIMDELANSMEAKKLIAMYVSLAKQLEKSMLIASPEVKEKLAKGFETFLDGVKDGATEFSILNWVAETYYSIGKGFDEGATLNPKATLYYNKAISTYKKVLEITPASYKIQLQKRVADTYKRMGNYSQAIALYKEILGKKSTYLSLQEEVCYTFQEWGQSLKKAGKASEAEDKFLAALLGAEVVNRKPIFWGWASIAKRTAGKAGFENQFHNSRQRLVETRLGLAGCRTGEDRSKTLRKALQDIELTQQLYDLGTDQQIAGYDALMRRVQRELGVKVTGLEAASAAE